MHGLRACILAEAPGAKVSGGARQTLGKKARNCDSARIFILALVLSVRDVDALILQNISPLLTQGERKLVVCYNLYTSKQRD